ncbi:hypothetical protein KQI36_14655 [Clostridium senegalense]|uniref:hypothetical protein n=1 Tax=Clostridium senegalense TaxID=1465809 RepID=UPI001C108230|nr:hypothetical protein [Clostridium senegalense]MBU5227871.1 hypothetical protein [Clostridium senegalense]
MKNLNESKYEAVDRYFLDFMKNQAMNNIKKENKNYSTEYKMHASKNKTEKW